MRRLTKSNAWHMGEAFTVALALQQLFWFIANNHPQNSIADRFGWTCLHNLLIKRPSITSKDNEVLKPKSLLTFSISFVCKCVRLECNGQFQIVNAPMLQTLSHIQLRAHSMFRCARGYPVKMTAERNGLKTSDCANKSALFALRNIRLFSNSCRCCCDCCCCCCSVLNWWHSCFGIISVKFLKKSIVCEWKPLCTIYHMLVCTATVSQPASHHAEHT